MKSATIPSVRVEPEFRDEVERVLGEGESLSQFVEAAVRACVLQRKSQAEFVARGMASLAGARRSGDHADAGEVMHRLGKQTRIGKEAPVRGAPVSCAVRFTRQAAEDIERLHDFVRERELARDGDLALAERALEAIGNGMAALRFSPFTCRKAGDNPRRDLPQHLARHPCRAHIRRHVFGHHADRPRGGPRKSPFISVLNHRMCRSNLTAASGGRTLPA